MKTGLQRYAEGICRYHRIAQMGDLEALKGTANDAPNAERIREAASAIAGVSKAVLETEWDNGLCTILMAETSIGNLRLDVRLSKVAPVAMCRWIERVQWTLTPDTQIPVGQRFQGLLSNEAVSLQETLCDILNAQGYLVFAEADFEFEIELTGREGNSGNALRGATFFFG